MNKSDFNPQVYPAPLSGLKSNSTSPFASYGTTKELMKRSYSVTTSSRLAGTLPKDQHGIGSQQSHCQNKGQDVPFGHVYIPTEILCRDLSVGTASAGGDLVETTVRPQLADALIPYSSLIASGITVLDDFQGNVNFQMAIPILTLRATRDCSSAYNGRNRYNQRDVTPTASHWLRSSYLPHPAGPKFCRCRIRRTANPTAGYRLAC